MYIISTLHDSDGKGGKGMGSEKHFFFNFGAAYNIILYYNPYNFVRMVKLS
jgi:hypothetical protein